MIWLELRCDMQRPTFASDRCYSDLNRGPMSASTAGRNTLLHNVHQLEAEAVRHGWVKTRTTLICPACKSAPPASERSPK